MRRALAWIGVALFAVAWFVPVIKDQEGLRGMEAKFGGADRPSGRSGPPGWQACRFAWDVMNGQPKCTWQPRACGATCLTNIAMLVAVAFVIRGRASRAIGIALLACTAFNLSWVYLPDVAMGESLRPGYYIWTASFAVVGFALLPRHE